MIIGGEKHDLKGKIIIFNSGLFYHLAQTEIEVSMKLSKHIIKKGFLFLSSILVLELVLACSPTDLALSTEVSQVKIPNDVTNTPESQSLPIEEVPLEQHEFTTDLVPMFYYDYDFTYVIDYQRSKYVKLDFNQVNSKYYTSLRNNGNEISFFDIVSRQNVQTVHKSDCNYLAIHFLAGDYLLTHCKERTCPPRESTIQFWHVPSNKLIKSFEVGSETGCYSYLDSIVSPDGRFVLLTGTLLTNLFSIDPPEEIEIDEYMGIFFNPSADNEFFVGNDRDLFKWVDNGFNFVESVGTPYSSNYLSVSAGAKQMAYRDSSSDPNALVVYDRENQKEVLRVYESDIMGGDGMINNTAFSHDGQLLLISGEQDDEQIVLLLDISTMNILYSNQTQNMIARPRVINLPESVRDAWDWQDY